MILTADERAELLADVREEHDRIGPVVRRAEHPEEFGPIPPYWWSDALDLFGADG